MLTICVTSENQDLKQFVNCYENVDKQKTYVTITSDFPDSFILKMDEENTDICVETSHYTYMYTNCYETLASRGLLFENNNIIG